MTLSHIPPEMWTLSEQRHCAKFRHAVGRSYAPKPQKEGSITARAWLARSSVFAAGLLLWECIGQLLPLSQGYPSAIFRYIKALLLNN